MSNPNPSVPSTRAPRWIVCLGLLGLLGYGIFIAYYFVPSAGGADSSGYLNSGRLLARGELRTHSRVIPELTLTSPFQLVPLGFVCEPRPDSVQLTPTYPVGLPLQFAAAGLLAGWTVGPYLVCVGAAVAAVWLCYLAARELGVSPLLALVGAAALGTSPMFVFIAIQPLSDVVATAWCLAAIYTALRSRRQTQWALLCGVACTMAVLVRPTNVLVLPAVAVLLGHWRRLLLAAAAGLPGAVGLALYQHHLYGSAFRSGYGSIFEIFRAENFAPTVRHYATWLPRLLCPALLVLPLAALWRWREHARALVALILWAGAILVFYAYYDVTKEVWWSLRFVLPAFPALILAGLLGFEVLVRRLSRPHAAIAFAIALAIWTGLIVRHWGRDELHVLIPSVSERTYILVGKWTHTHLPPNAVVASMVASGTVFYYTDLPILRWDCIPPEVFENYAAALQRAGRPLYALLFDLEEKEAFHDHLRGHWERVVDVKTSSVWKWTGP